jgi:hypothetical protein
LSRRTICHTRFVVTPSRSASSRAVTPGDCSISSRASNSRRPRWHTQSLSPDRNIG